jgi:hypothetical protein
MTLRFLNASVEQAAVEWSRPLAIDVAHALMVQFSELCPDADLTVDLAEADGAVLVLSVSAAGHAEPSEFGLDADGRLFYDSRPGWEGCTGR